MEVTATELKTRLGKYLDLARTEPVIIQKTGRKTAVLVSFDEFQRLIQTEDDYWAQKAAEAEKEGYVGPDASLKFLNDKYV